MNEHQRMHYLDAMGVESFVPRFLLPRAKPSAACILVPLDRELGGELTSAPTSGNANEHVSESDVNADTLRNINDGLNSVLSALNLDSALPSDEPAESNGLHESRSKLTQDAQSKARDRAETAQTESGATSGNPEHQPASFDLALWYTDSNFQIIDSRQEGDALPTDALLVNILRATGLIQAQLKPAELQRWPISHTPVTDKSWSAACGMMFDFLSYRFEKRPAKQFLLFGESAAKAILGENFNYSEAVYSTVEAEAYGMSAMVLPALRDFLYEPSSKKELWSTLSHLRKV